MAEHHLYTLVTGVRFPLGLPQQHLSPSSDTFKGRGVEAGMLLPCPSSTVVVRLTLIQLAKVRFFRWVRLTATQVAGNMTPVTNNQAPEGTMKLNEFVNVTFNTEQGVGRAKGYWHSGDPNHTFYLAESKDGPPTLKFYLAKIC